MAEQVFRDDQTIEIETDDIRFRKERIEGGDRSIAEIRYSLKSQATDKIACRIRDPLVDEQTVDSIYLPPTVKNWRVEDSGAILFEGLLTAGSTSSTTATINLAGLGDSDLLDSEPSIDIARPNTDGSSDEQVHSAIPDDSDEPPEREFSEPPPTIPLEIPDEPTDTEPGDTEPDHQPTPSPNAIVSEVITALRSEDVTDEQREELRKALGVEIDQTEPDSAGSLRAKVDHLQSKVEDLMAYTDALEMFIDANGTGREILDELNASMEENQQNLVDLEATTSTLSDGISELTGRLDGLETELTRLDSLTESMKQLQSEVDGIESSHSSDLELVKADIESLSSDIERNAEMLDTEVAGIKRELAATKKWRKSLGQALSGFDESAEI